MQLKGLVSVATNQGEMFDQDHKCIDLLTKIITSDHKFNDLSLSRLPPEDDYQEVKNRFESSSFKKIFLLKGTGKEINAL